MHHSKVLCDNYKDKTKSINVHQLQISVFEVPIQRLIKIQASNMLQQPNNKFSIFVPASVTQRPVV